jgi:hypothetical protein
MADWAFKSQTRGGSTVFGRLTDLEDRALNVYINQPGDAAGTMDLLSDQCTRDWLQPGVHELIIERDDLPVETIFQLATAQPNLDTEGGGFISFGWLGIMSYLSNSFIGPSYTQTAVPQNEAAWNIVATVQAKANASWGLVDGDDTASQPSKSIEQADERDAKEALQALAEREDGFDMRVNTDGELETFYPNRGSDKTESIVLEHGVNCTVSNLQEDASPGAVVNWVRVKGGGGASAEAEDTTSQLLYGRREAIVSYTDETHPDRLLEYANAIIARRATPSIVPVVELDTDHDDYEFGAVWLGDTVRLKAEIGNYMTIDDAYRMVAGHFKISNEDDESVGLEFNAA